jgi:hypothetical protein
VGKGWLRSRQTEQEVARPWDDRAGEDSFLSPPSRTTKAMRKVGKFCTAREIALVGGMAA